jgi:hypothetical protein
VSLLLQGVRKENYALVGSPETDGGESWRRRTQT